MKPNPTFNDFRPDEVAECWEGVTRPTYRELWALMRDVPPPPAWIEDCGPEPASGEEALAYHWGKLSEAAQTELNALADKMDEEARRFFDQELGDRP
jgi:hypothetical protein